jgi:hypothetical protein
MEMEWRSLEIICPFNEILILTDDEFSNAVMASSNEVRKWQFDKTCKVSVFIGLRARADMQFFTHYKIL